MEKAEEIRYVGVNDHQIDLFEGQFDVPQGMAYNSYVLCDQKTAVFDTVDIKFCDEWLKNIERELNGKTPDYLVVLHMEPDHSGSIRRFWEAYPTCKLVATSKAVSMMPQFFGEDFLPETIPVKTGDTLNLGSRELSFLTAPMVHWPEVMMAYDAKSKTLFSADAFGKFGALDKDEDWTDEARRYYFGIVGKFGPQVQNVLKSAAELDIERICPLHGPVLEEDLGYYMKLYDTWSSYSPEEEGVVINFTSVYGNTKKAVLYLEECLKELGCPKVVVNDLARCDIHEAVADCFRYSGMILATTTYNGGIFPFMHQLLHGISERGFKKRKIGLVENGTWALAAAKTMVSLLEGCKELEFAETIVSIKSAMTDQNRQQLMALAKEFV